MLSNQKISHFINANTGPNLKLLEPKKRKSGDGAGAEIK